MILEFFLYSAIFFNRTWTTWWLANVKFLILICPNSFKSRQLSRFKVLWAHSGSIKDCQHVEKNPEHFTFTELICVCMYLCVLICNYSVRTCASKNWGNNEEINNDLSTILEEAKVLTSMPRRVNYIWQNCSIFRNTFAWVLYVCLAM